MKKFGNWKPPVWWKDFQVDAPRTLDALWSAAGRPGYFVYRGLSDARYRLSPRVARNVSHIENEWNMMIEFLAFARSHGQELSNKLELLALAQHHGLPTRCMDVTSAFGVALYFAVTAKPSSCGAVVWCIDLEAMPDVAEKWYVQNHPDGADDLRCVYQIFPSLPTLSGREIVPVSNHDQVNTEVDRYMTDSTKPRHPPVLVAPPHISRRMTAQDANFALIDPNGGHLAQQLKNIGCEYALRGIWLSPRLCQSVRKHLLTLGITKRLLFPDIDNLASDITERYSH